MVNAAKRMRGLSEKIFAVTCGQGAVKIPENAKVKISRIVLRVPTGTHPLRVPAKGARDFWHQELRRLKYWNPALRIDVETLRTPESGPLLVAVEYESTDPTALQALQPKPLPERTPLPLKLLRAAKRGQQTAQVQELNPHERPPVPTEQELADIAKYANGGAVTVKAQPAADPSSPQTTSAPKPLYTRTLAAPVTYLTHTKIWDWIRAPTGLPNVANNKFQRAQHRIRDELIQFKKQAAKDRALVKAGVDAMKREQADLKKARAAAEKMANEAL